MSWVVVSGEERRRDAPYTFFLPHPEYIAALQVGDIAKLLFEYEGDVEQYGGERMWVSIDRLTDEGFEGALLSDPCEDDIAKGTVVQFRAEHILDFQFGEKRPAPVVPEQREYWDRCLIDRCILGGTPVKYLYREEPEPQGDRPYADSGWRLRGAQGDATDDEMEDRDVIFVALGAVLNRDDSWLHLLDAPVGSAFMRNFETGQYEQAGS